MPDLHLLPYSIALSQYVDIIETRSLEGRAMGFLHVIWDDYDNPEGNVQHIAEHGLTIEDVMHVLDNPLDKRTSRSTGRPCCFGYTPGGDFHHCDLRTGKCRNDLPRNCVRASRAMRN